MTEDDFEELQRLEDLINNSYTDYFEILFVRYIDIEGYTVSINFNSNDQVYYGKVLGIKDLISCEGKTIDLITKAFKKAIKDYENEF